MISNEGERHCSRCHRPLRPNALFCPHCGSSGDDSREPSRSTRKDYLGAEFTSRWKSLKFAGTLFGMLLAVTFVAGLTYTKNSSPWLDLAFSGVQAIIIIVFVGLRLGSITPLLRAPQLTRRDGARLVGMVIVCFTAVTCYFALIHRIGIPMNPVSLQYTQAGWSLLAILVPISLMPAIFEELAFRGIIQSALEDVFNERDACIIQAALFSVLHLLPMIFVSHFFMGLCFGILRLVSRSLYPGMAVHATWNSLVLLDELHFS